MKIPAKNKKYKKGFTIVEIMLATAITVIIMVAIVAFEVNVLNYNRSSHTALNNAQQAQNILKIIAREIREMSRGISGLYPILSVATSSLTFYADIEGNGSPDQIRYYLTFGDTTNTLYRGVTRPSGTPPSYDLANEDNKIIAAGLGNSSTTPVFEYFDGDYDGTGSALSYPVATSSVRLIKVNLVTATDPKGIVMPKTFSTQISLRVLKDNL